MSEQLGILGVGHLASYMVAGLRHAGDQRPILLSPRNRQRSQALAEQHACEIAADNQQVVDRCRLILLAVRPNQVRSLLESLTFSADHLLVSCVAGMPLAQLGELAGPAQVVRTLPLACAEVGEGAVPLYPNHPSARRLLSQLGNLIPFDNEDSFELASTAACMNGWIYPFLARLTDWYTEQGMAAEQARELVLHSVRGATGLAAARPEWPLQAISDSIATDGTFTKLGLDLLESNDAFSPWQDACEQVNKSLKG
ncbi:NAD(P)-binding domain-containing protein [Marinobacterium arenosum]|uniref:NAD(P)-binding domain-containing protein n=1 Tax=Marinobacterium arenosum TaxID=2862496 RepID=UPI001C9694C3|nr:NAD(P)-binding domain-containing protein [Marinobacterium arenosum]MBY4679024.1 NAD(P)-binding domain-containing protein [Marinobacterium arenosum]